MQRVYISNRIAYCNFVIFMFYTMILQNFKECFCQMENIEMQQAPWAAMCFIGCLGFLVLLLISLKCLYYFTFEYCIIELISLSF